MDFDLDDQQRTLRDEARRFLEAEANLGYARQMMDDERGHNEKLTARMADLGWMALPFDETHGGLGMGTIALSILLTEMGRVTLPGPYLSSIALAGTAIAIAGTDEQKARLLPGIAAGTTTAAFARDGHVDLRDGRLYGERRFVLDGLHAEQIVVIAHLEDDSPGLFLAEPTERIAVQTMDATRRTAHLRFDGADAEPMDHALFARILDHGALAFAADSLGGAERVLELSVDYAKQREQFGRPIGSFQAMKHTAADMHVDIESLRAAVYYAAWALETGAPDASRAASVAKAWASDAYRRVAQAGIQMHGGVGFTWEHDMHLFFKRAKFNETAFGDATYHRERIARLVAP